MLSDHSGLIGGTAAVLTTVAFIPQAWMMWKSRRADGISLGMYGIFTSGIVLWLLYGLMIDAWPLIVSNICTLALALFILGMKIRFG
jgi:MtN3 and saliva related transmembrane protein